MASNNHPDRPDDALLASACRILSSSSNTFLMLTRKQAMATIKNGAKIAQTKEVNAAEKKLAKAGVAKPKHVPSQPLLPGVDAAPDDVVQSVVPPTNQEVTVTAPTTVPEAQLAKEAAVKAKIEAKAAKAAEAATKKAEREASAAKAKAERDEIKAAKAAEAATKKAEREATRAASAGTRERTYNGPMLALADRVKQGLYVRSATGQLRSTDELAQALDDVPAANVVKLGMAVLGHAENKYAKLNLGQQSMNYRNSIRGAVRKGGENAPTITSIRDYVVSNGLIAPPKPPKDAAEATA
jgi:hypothetical protein